MNVVVVGQSPFNFQHNHVRNIPSAIDPFEFNSTDIYFSYHSIKIQVQVDWHLEKNRIINVEWCVCVRAHTQSHLGLMETLRRKSVHRQAHSFIVLGGPYYFGKGASSLDDGRTKTDAKPAHPHIVLPGQNLRVLTNRPTGRQPNPVSHSTIPRMPSHLRWGFDKRFPTDSLERFTLLVLLGNVRMSKDRLKSSVDLSLIRVTFR